MTTGKTLLFKTGKAFLFQNGKNFLFYNIAILTYLRIKLTKNKIIKNEKKQDKTSNNHLKDENCEFFSSS